MAIVKMKRLRLACMRSDKDTLLERLQELGCVEIDQISTDPEDPRWGNLKPIQQQTAGAAREQKNAAERALSVLKRYAPEKSSFLAPKPSLTAGQLLDQHSAQDAQEKTEEVNAAQRRLEAIRGQSEKLQGQIHTLTPWSNLDVGLDAVSTGQVIIQFGVLPAVTALEEVDRRLKETGDLTELTCSSSDRDQHYLLLVCHNSQWEAVQDALKEFGWSRIAMRDWTGTARENILALEKQLEQLKQESQEIEGALSAMGDRWNTIRRWADRNEAQERKEEFESRLLGTTQVLFMEGWVPAEKWESVRQMLQAYPVAAEAVDPTPEEYAQVPVQLKNNAFTRPLNMVTEMYSLPAYGSLDPNPLMAPFFILFYGIMMADMGYGLLMFLLGAIVLKKKKPGGTFGHMCGLLVLCGISTFIMGALTGGFFGDFIPQLMKLINPESTFAFPALFTPLEDTMMILIGAMALGVVQIITGMAIGFYKKLRDGHLMDAIWEEVTWWVVMLGLVLMILGVTNLVLIVGGIMVVVGSGWNAKGFGKVTAVFGSLYNHITGYFGDILSYSRLMALMLAGSVIAQVFNTLGAIPGNVVIFIVISLVGNTLNFGLNLLGCYVHDLRLQCLEYFGKFYEDGGKPFRPLDYKTKYYNVVK